MYLYSEPGDYGAGNGNGKTHLMWCAFKYIARRTALFMDSDYLDADPRFTCRVVDVPRLVGDFKNRLAKCKDGDVPAYHVPDDRRSFWSETFDGYRDYLAREPIIFLDDLGSTPARGMVGETYESIIDMRALCNLPSFYTSNFSPDQLDKRIGARAASRVFRNECKIIQVRAPDYWRVKHGAARASGIGAQAAVTVTSSPPA